jgi:Na+/H+-translocating membrane pyrophosphatase
MYICQHKNRGVRICYPYKETVDPAVNSWIEITSIVALLLLAVLAH